MRRFFLAALLGTLVLGGLALPQVSHAQEIPFPYFGGLTDKNLPLLPCTGFLDLGSGYQVVSVEATNALPPCSSLCDFFPLFNRLLWFALSVLTVIIIPFTIFAGGAMIFLSGGNPGRRSQGISIITGTLLGTAFILGAFLITNQLLLIVFKEGWGDALQKAAKDQATQIGISPDNVPSFAWDNISCSITNVGGVNVNFDTINKPPSAGKCIGGCVADANQCYNDASPMGASGCTSPTPVCCNP